MLFHVADFNDGGIETSLMQWLRIFDRARFAVTLSVMFSSPAFEQRFRAQIPADVNVEILTNKPWLNTFQKHRYAHTLSKLGRVGRDVFNTLAVRPYVKARVAELAQRHEIIIDFDMSLRRLAGRFGTTWLGVNHFSFDARLGGRRRKMKRMLTQYGRYDGIAALNRHMAEEATALFDGHLRNVFVLPNAIDIDRIRENAAAQEAPPCAGPYIVSVARLDEIQKDHRTLLRAYAQLAATHEDALKEDLVIVGDGGFRAELEALAAELGVEKRVHFTGYRNNPHAVVAGASALVLSSRYEGMPMVLLEALALGKPVISTDCPTGPREILDDGKFGLLVPVGDVDAMAQAISRLLLDDTLRDGFTRTALGRAREYGLEASNARFVVCLERLLAGRG
ncbi:glycosyl transferase [Burkholderia sp. Leaf177]|uniref:glycosyltransferase n=1 Tax=Burkholderia sp. Leaf177 TaxID=1736287 RepID=UPI0006FF0BF3|nr:glycosyltransferase [Burkholderia sp. Leaf177]KQR84526.1 glycosyl transferase [Burkholderia sp. Leaf177]